MATKAQNARQPYGLTDELVDGLLNGASTHEEVFGDGGIYRQLTKRLFERMLETEMTHHLGYQKHQKPDDEQRLSDGGNARNGSSKKTLKTAQSEVELAIPRDRNGQFEPMIIPKGSSRLPEIDRTILALYGGGMSTRDIAAELERAYGIEVSHTFISEVTDSIIEDVKQWRNRPLDAVYTAAFFDGFHLSVRENGKVVTKCLYVALALDTTGHKQCLGLWIAQTESASFWLQVFTEMPEPRRSRHPDCHDRRADGLHRSLAVGLPAVHAPNLHRAPAP
jgi:putative transposase